MNHNYGDRDEEALGCVLILITLGIVVATIVFKVIF
jgi:hypothetical protein